MFRVLKHHVNRALLLVVFCTTYTNTDTQTQKHARTHTHTHKHTRSCSAYSNTQSNTEPICLLSGVEQHSTCMCNTTHATAAVSPITAVAVPPCVLATPKTNPILQCVFLVCKFCASEPRPAVACASATLHFPSHHLQNADWAV